MKRAHLEIKRKNGLLRKSLALANEIQVNLLPQRVPDNERLDIAAKSIYCSATGQIIFLGTDGIWETQNSRGRRFGKKSVNTVLSQNASFSAEEIITRMVNELDNYRGNQEPEDDITLMVIKIAPEVPLAH